MKTLFCLATSALLLLSLALTAQTTVRYVCTPCGMECDKNVYDKPGTCPVCGARLIDQKTAEAQRAGRPPARKVGILIFDGVEIIDYTGPWEVFGAAGYDVYTVAATREPITTAMGMTVVPKYTLADAPQPDVLLVPGGGIEGPQHSSATLKWIAEKSAAAQETLSVCNGAFILGSAGLLDGLSATTTYHLLDKFKTEFPKTQVVRDQRFVDNGKIITAGGLTAGIDGALHVVSKLAGNGIAQAVALNLEYDWRPRDGYARGALAESRIPDLDLDDLGSWAILSTEGELDRWEIVAQVTSGLSGEELLDKLGQALVTQANWKSARATSASSKSALVSAWKFSDREGKPWSGVLSVQSLPSQTGKYTAKLSIARAG